jgi:spoIIIJ-associated protein
VDEAIEIALLELDADRNEVEVDVVSKGRSGILGIGAEPAKVRVSRITGDEGKAGAGLKIVGRILKEMEVEARPTIRSSGTGPDDPAIIDVQGQDAGLLIGHRGETLQALQFVVNLLLNRQENQRTHVIVDVEQYRERRSHTISTLAKRMADRVIASGRSVTLEPMSASDRRTVHMALADRIQVTTESSGEGRDRKVTISLVGSGQQDG